MPVFPSRPLNPSRLNTLLRKQPLFFGVPFIALMVATSFGLATVTQVKYDVRDQRVKQVCSSSRSFSHSFFHQVSSNGTLSSVSLRNNLYVLTPARPGNERAGA
jgi:hypothetical protein